MYISTDLYKKKHVILTKFMDKYQVALSKFYKELIDAEHKLRYENKRKYGVDKLKLGRTLHKLLTDAYVNIDAAGEKFRQPLTLLHRKNTINEYRVEFVVEYELVPDVGYKLTCMAGGGV